ncbi:MAG: SurA N-terminal domain-containing protein [Halanaerobiales bacterium]
MLSKLRNYSKIIIIIVSVAMVASGALYATFYGFGNRSANNPNLQARNIAEVNGQQITEDQYYSALSSAVGMETPERTQEVPTKYSVLNTLIERTLILEQAEKMGVEARVTEEDVDEIINQILETNQMTEEDLVAYLENNDNSLESLKGEIRESLKVQNRITQVQEQSYSDVTVTEEEIVEEYEKVQVQAIGKTFGEDKEAAKTSINKALNELEEDSEFAEVAAEYTELNQVDFSMSGRQDSSLPENVMDRAFSIEKGAVSDIIESEDAFYIIKVLDKKIASGEDYENAKEDLRSSILEQKQEEAFENWLNSVKADSDITINDPLLRGYKAFSNSDYTTAIEDFEEAMEAYPTPMISVYLAQAYQNTGQSAKAVETFANLIGDYPNDWEFHYMYAALLMDQEEVDQEEIIGLLEKASELAGSDYWPHYQIYAIYSQLGAEEEAQAELELMNELMKQMQEEQNAQEETSQNSEDIDSTENIDTNTPAPANDDVEVPVDNTTE